MKGVSILLWMLMEGSRDIEDFHYCVQRCCYLFVSPFSLTPGTHFSAVDFVAEPRLMGLVTMYEDQYRVFVLCHADCRHPATRIPAAQRFLRHRLFDPKILTHLILKKFLFQRLHLH